MDMKFSWYPECIMPVASLTLFWSLCINNLCFISLLLISLTMGLWILFFSKIQVLLALLYHIFVFSFIYLCLFPYCAFPSTFSGFILLVRSENPLSLMLGTRRTLGFRLIFFLILQHFHIYNGIAWGWHLNLNTEFFTSRVVYT
jgi:hypothetical protein